MEDWRRIGACLGKDRSAELAGRNQSYTYRDVVCVRDSDKGVAGVLRRNERLARGAGVEVWARQALKSNVVDTRVAEIADDVLEGLGGLDNRGYDGSRRGGGRDDGLLNELSLEKVLEDGDEGVRGVVDELGHAAEALKERAGQNERVESRCTRREQTHEVIVLAAGALEADGRDLRGAAVAENGEP